MSNRRSAHSTHIGLLRDEVEGIEAFSTPIDTKMGSQGLLLELNATDIAPSGGPAQMSDFTHVASYNWLDSDEPVILVPGSPALWSPPVHTRRINPDKGEVFIDQNAARYSCFPMEPLFRAVYHLHPEFNMNDINIAIDRNRMGKLFDFVTNSSRAFEIDVEIIGNTAVFVRREKSVTEFITEFRGFGYTFPEEYTTWDKEVKGSSSHHRIASFCFAGMKYLLRYESDGYLAEKAGVVKKSTAPGKGADADVDSAITSLGSDGSLNIGEKQPLAENRLAIRSQGSEIDQRAVIDIKTRAAHKTLDTEIVLPRLWMSQTANLIAAYHKGGRFDNVQVLDVRDGIEQWQKNHAVELRKLNALMLRIITTVKGTVSKKCRIKRAERGKLEIKELGDGHASALPEDLQLKLQGNGDSEKYYDWDDDRGLLLSERKSEESDKDYTACSSEVCGYCGHCRY